MEGRDINKGTVDVVVCDGFVGNVVLKFAEGLAKAILTMVKGAIMNGGFFAKLGGLLITPALRKLMKTLDPEAYGGALLLGVRAPFFICHGSSKARAIKSAIGVAATAWRATSWPISRTPSPIRRRSTKSSVT